MRSQTARLIARSLRLVQKDFVKYAAPEHKVDREIVLEVTPMQKDLVKYAAPEHKVDREVVLEVTPVQKESVKKPASEHREKAIPWKEVKRRQRNLEALEAERKHKANHEVVLEVAPVRKDFVNQHAAPEHKVDREIVLEVTPLEEHVV